jgi:ferric-dicitrate binding protein FerR (iron transport regulator)
MSDRHIAPHRFADADAGRMDVAEREALERHAAVCSDCAGARARVRRAHQALRDVAETEPPELGWDHIATRIHWATSAARRARERADHTSWRRPWLALAASAAVAMGAAGLVLWRSGGQREERVAAGPVEVAPSGPGTDTVSAPRPLAGVVTFARGVVEVDGVSPGSAAPAPDPGGPANAFDRPVGPGARLATGDGRVAVQFGAGSLFALEPYSAVRLVAFDERAIEIDVVGTVDVHLAARRPDQTFVVSAGPRRVVVRGTAFRVAHRGASLNVICTHGHVVVHDGDQQVDVLAGERLALLGRALATTRAQPIDAHKLEAFARSMAAPMLPVFTTAEDVLATTAMLAPVAAPAQPVRVDGVEIGAGSFAMRVMPGRHYVEGARASAAWVELRARDRREASVSEAPERPAAAAVAAARAAEQESVRMPQLDLALARKGASLRSCVKPLAKQDLAEGAFIAVELGLNRDGSQAFLNIIDKNVSAEVAGCVRDVIDAIEFPPGPAETLHKTIGF